MSTPSMPNDDSHAQAPLPSDLFGVIKLTYEQVDALFAEVVLVGNMRILAILGIPSEFWPRVPGRRHTLDELRAMPYPQYLHTPHWQDVKRAAHKRDQGRCQQCKTTKLLHVHHLTYEHLGQEHLYLEDVIVLCKACHEARHMKDQTPCRSR